ncbi:MAG: enoyl-CoA hydratase-related protein [Bacteroidales bacterium]|jgi:methylglutaconyl-CoA hydratase|nr:enoyl-CoA hydratase-related protein [Bacteroidales bacterium]
MNKYLTIEIEKRDQISTIWLNRPEIHNAFNEIMISEIIEAFKILNADVKTRIIVIRGKGKSFCAGADLNWMKDVANYTYKENYNESFKLSVCFNTIYTCKKVTMAVVHGSAIGGANGLLAACDFVYAEANTVFSLSEVKIGLIPACIGPYIIKRIGEFPAKEFMLSGVRFNGDIAENKGLINKSLDQENLEDYYQKSIKLILTSGPNAVSQCKEVIHNICNEIDYDESLIYTAKMIAETRSSEEGQEGMTAFLEKRKPNWISKLD